MIVAVKKEDRVLVGMSICDGCINMSEKDLALADNLPFWKVKGEKGCYVCTEDLSYSTDLLRYNDYVFKGITDGKSVIENVIPKMKELLGKNNRLVNGEEWHNRMLIIKGNKIFEVKNDFCVFEVDDYVAIGHERYLQSSLYATREIDATESILTSIRNTSRMLNSVIFPITIFDSKTKKGKIYYQ